MGILDSLAGGVVGGLSSLGSSLVNWRSQEDTNRLQEELSNTAVQRRVEDMKKAGLNPVLAAGNPASSPALKAPEMGDPGEAALSGAQRAQAIALTEEQQKLVALQQSRQAAETRGVELDNQLKENLLGPRTAEGQASSEYAVRTLNNRIESQFNQTAISSAASMIDQIRAEWTRQVATGESSKYEGVNLVQLEANFAAARTAAAKQGIEQSKATVLSMAQAIQASGMNADALKKIGIAPIVADMIRELLSTAAKLAF